MPNNPDRGKLKPVQAAKLLQLAVDRRASLKDRAWAMDTLVDTKGRISNEDIAKAAKKLVKKNVRSVSGLRENLLGISSASVRRSG